MKKRFLFIIIPVLLIIFIVVAFIICNNEAEINAQDISHIEVTLSRINIDKMYDEINFSVNEHSEIEDIIRLENELFWYNSMEGTNTVPWGAKFEFHYKDGTAMTREYTKTGEDKKFFSKYLKIN